MNARFLQVNKIVQRGTQMITKLQRLLMVVGRSLCRVVLVAVLLREEETGGCLNDSTSY
jgi:hypothetical protein